MTSFCNLLHLDWEFSSSTQVFSSWRAHQVTDVDNLFLRLVHISLSKRCNSKLCILWVLFKKAEAVASVFFRISSCSFKCAIFTCSHLRGLALYLKLMICSLMLWPDTSWEHCSVDLSNCVCNLANSALFWVSSFSSSAICAFADCKEALQSARI